MRKPLIGLLCAALSGWAPAARAATFVTTANTYSTYYETSALQPFDSALGWLTGITLQIDAQSIYDYAATFTNLAPSPQLTTGSAHLSENRAFNVVVNGIAYSLQVTGSDDISYTGTQSVLFINEFVATGSTTLELDPALFGGFIDQVNNCGVRSGICVRGPGILGIPDISSENLSFIPWHGGDAFSSAATYTLTYIYTPFGVPEPTTWAMMLVGFAMIGAGVRYRRALPSAEVRRD